MFSHLLPFPFLPLLLPYSIVLYCIVLQCRFELWNSNGDNRECVCGIGTADHHWSSLLLSLILRVGQCQGSYLWRGEESHQPSAPPHSSNADIVSVACTASQRHGSPPLPLLPATSRASDYASPPPPYYRSSGVTLPLTTIASTTSNTNCVPSTPPNTDTSSAPRDIRGDVTNAMGSQRFLSGTSHY